MRIDVTKKGIRGESEGVGAFKISRSLNYLS
jgi:hypothetical protein